MSLNLEDVDELSLVILGRLIGVEPLDNEEVQPLLRDIQQAMNNEVEALQSEAYSRGYWYKLLTQPHKVLSEKKLSGATELAAHAVIALTETTESAENSGLIPRAQSLAQNLVMYQAETSDDAKAELKSALVQSIDGLNAKSPAGIIDKKTPDGAEQFLKTLKLAIDDFGAIQAAAAEYEADLKPIFNVINNSQFELVKQFERICKAAGIEYKAVPSADGPMREAAWKVFFDLAQNNRLELNRIYGYVFWRSYGKQYDVQLNGGFPVPSSLQDAMNDALEDPIIGGLKEVALEGGESKKVDALHKARARNVYQIATSEEDPVETLCLQEADQEFLALLKLLDTGNRIQIKRYDKKSLLAILKVHPPGQAPQGTLADAGAPDPAVAAFQPACIKKLLVDSEVVDGVRITRVVGHLDSASNRAADDKNQQTIADLIDYSKQYQSAHGGQIILECDANFVVCGQKDYDDGQPPKQPPAYLDPDDDESRIEGVDIDFNKPTSKGRSGHAVANQQWVAKGDKMQDSDSMIRVQIPGSGKVTVAPTGDLFTAENTSDHQIVRKGKTLTMNVGFKNYRSGKGEKDKLAKIAKLQAPNPAGNDTLWEVLNKAFLVSARGLVGTLAPMLKAHNASVGQGG